MYGKLINEIEDEPDDAEFDEDDYKSKQDLYEYFCSKCDVVREKEFEQNAPLYNVLSGSMIKFNIGEGILDFLYADFDTPFKEEYSFFKALSIMGERYRKENDVEIKETSPTKIHNHTEAIVQEFYDYTSTTAYANSVSKQSLYTAICPPVFRELADEQWRFCKKIDAVSVNGVSEITFIIVTLCVLFCSSKYTEPFLF